MVLELVVEELTILMLNQVSKPQGHGDADSCFWQPGDVHIGL